MAKPLQKQVKLVTKHRVNNIKFKKLTSSYRLEVISKLMHLNFYVLSFFKCKLLKIHLFLTADSPSRQSEAGRHGAVGGWATWCAPCISELPSLSKLQEKLDNTKFKLLLISIDRSGEKVFKPFLKKIGLTSLKSGNDPKTLLMQKLGLTGIPTTLLVSPTGEVIGKLVGTAKWDTRSAIDLVNFYLQK